VDRAVSTSRFFASTPEAILAAFTDGARLVRWWGPAGFRSTFQIFEPRPGGAWRFTMHGPDGAAYPNQSVLDELGPDRIVVRHLSPPRFTLTIGLEPQGAGTRLTWTQVFETAEVAAGLRALVVPANEQNLDRLEAELRGAG
jgi:uncharacterized protein YndB with AHSA1/START domain